MKDQDKPITNEIKYFTADSGSAGLFLCDNSNPFDSTDDSIEPVGRKGAVIQFVEDTVVTSWELNAVFGAELGLSYEAGDKLNVEVVKMAITSGSARIYLKY